MAEKLYGILTDEKKEAWDEIKALVPPKPLEWFQTVGADCLLQAADLLVTLRNDPKKKGYKTLRRILNSILFQYKVPLADRKRMGLAPGRINLVVISKAEVDRLKQRTN